MDMVNLSGKVCYWSAENTYITAKILDSDNQITSIKIEDFPFMCRACIPHIIGTNKEEVDYFYYRIEKLVNFHHDIRKVLKLRDFSSNDERYYINIYSNDYSKLKSLKKIDKLQSLSLFDERGEKGSYIITIHEINKHYQSIRLQVDLGITWCSKITCIGKSDDDGNFIVSYKSIKLQEDTNLVDFSNNRLIPDNGECKGCFSYDGKKSFYPEIYRECYLQKIVLRLCRADKNLYLTYSRNSRPDGIYQNVQHLNIQHILPYLIIKYNICPSNIGITPKVMKLAINSDKSCAYNLFSMLLKCSKIFHVLPSLRSENPTDFNNI